MSGSVSHPLLLRARVAQPAVAAIPLDERLARVAESRRALAFAGEQIVDQAVREAGVPRRFARREVTSALMLLDALPSFADAIRPKPVPAVSGTTMLEWMPYGVVFGWHAANSPVWVPTVVAASALVAGNSIVARPSRRVRDTTGMVLDAIATAWPPDAIVTLDLTGPEAEALLVDREVDAIVAHASTTTCKRHMARLGAAYAEGMPMRVYIPEASGNDALIVLDGADLPRAAEAAALGGFANAGQLCMSAKRIIIQDSVAEEFTPLLVAATARLVIGDPEAEATDIGRLLAGGGEDHARDVLREAVTAGGIVLIGGERKNGLLAPTLVRLPRDRLTELRMWREEVFAPIRGVVQCTDVDDALALANDTPFGLGAAVFGGDPGVQDRCARGLRAARVLFDEGPMYQDPHLVVGGVGDSGLAGARPKVEQLAWARRIHRAATPA